MVLGFRAGVAMWDKTKLALGLVGGGMVRLLFIAGEDLEHTPNGVMAASELRRRSQRERETAQATLGRPAGPLRERGSRPRE